MTLTQTQFAQLIPTNSNAAGWYDATLAAAAKHQLDTKLRFAMFIAQVGHESSDFTRVSENLNYSAQRLLQVFPRYFTAASAAQAAGNPERIANIVYDDANRTSKLGNTQPGDGWRFRGAGLIQLTGRANIGSFGASLGMSAEAAADYCRTVEGALESAIWYWNSHGVSAFADRDDVRGATYAINGGYIGLDDRTVRYARAKGIIGDAFSSPSSPTVGAGLKRGDRGDMVKRAQLALGFNGASADGIFGGDTEAAVKSWQRLRRFPDAGALTADQLKVLLG